MTTQPTCSVHGAKHLFVFVGERNGADWFRCACMSEMRNAREALEPDSDFTIADVACEAEATALLGDDAVQAAVLMRQLEASLERQRFAYNDPSEPCPDCGGTGCRCICGAA